MCLLGISFHNCVVYLCQVSPRGKQRYWHGCQQWECCPSYCVAQQFSLAVIGCYSKHILLIGLQPFNFQHTLTRYCWYLNTNKIRPNAPAHTRRQKCVWSCSEKDQLYHISSSWQAAISKTDFPVNSLSCTAAELVPAHLERHKWKEKNEMYRDCDGLFASGQISKLRTQLKANLTCRPKL